MKRILLSTILLSLLVSCTHFEYFVATPPAYEKGKAILIGPFERRSMSFDPFVVQNLRDSLAFELFKQGYPAELAIAEGEMIRKKGVILGKDEIRALCQKRDAAIFIQGSVTEKEIGDFTDVDISSLVTFQVHDAQGEKVGEATVTVSDTLSDISVLQGIARRMAGALHDTLTAK